MGLLDDAIREHLELKRRRGADPGEVARQEQEALGPVRREVAAEEPVAELPLDDAPAEDVAYVEGADAILDPAAEPFAGEPLPVEGAEVVDPEGDPYPPAEVDPYEEPFATEDPYADVAYEEGANGAPAAGPDLGKHDDDATREFDVEDVFADDDAAGAAPPPAGAHDAEHDELEETPDFLQETPEHDRLWFEQKPPRDFDFDG